MSGFAVNGLGRDDEASVLEGNAVPSLVGVPPDRLVAFRWESGWIRVPIQVDERAVVDFATIYGDPEPSGFTVLTYTDPGTFTGPDADPLVDADDEIVFRVRDAGAKAPGQAGIPAGAVPGSGLEVAVANPSSGVVAWIYLFRGDETLDPLPPSPDVVYDFVLLSGDYKQTYDTGGGTGLGNPENSTVTTPSYRVGFSDRWLRVETAISRGGAPGTDLLERHRNRFRPDSCSRTEWTFSMGEGAFIVNKNGPVRALRAYVGANSGVTTHRIHEFYDSTEVIRTVLRVHEIPGVMDFFDWDASASGMTWRNDLNPQGVPVDGVPDTVVPGAFSWESLSGPQGSLAMVPVLDTDIPEFTWTSWYSDSIPAAAGPCDQQGDDNEAYGSSGIWRQGAVLNTDPAVLGDVYRFVFTRTMRYLGPNAPATSGAALRSEIVAPVTVTLSGYPASDVCLDGDGDDWAVCGEGCEPPAGASCGDCDDGDATVRPGAAELCDAVDNDCAPATGDGSSEPWLGDACDGADSDACTTGFSLCEVGARRCDDDPATSVDVCDGADNDCDGPADNPSCAAFDVDGNSRVDGFELAWLGRAFGACRTGNESPWWTPVDYDGDGCVDGVDLVILANFWARACLDGSLCP